MYTQKWDVCTGHALIYDCIVGKSMHLVLGKPFLRAPPGQAPLERNNAIKLTGTLPLLIMIVSREPSTTICPMIDPHMEPYDLMARLVERDCARGELY